MILPDVNVLIYAFRREAEHHQQYRQWLLDVIDDEPAFGLSDLVLSGLIRIVTNPRIFRDPTPVPLAFAFVERLLEQPNCVLVRPGPRHWPIFRRLCAESGAKGPLIPDAFFAALAIESGCEWITADRDYARFKGLRWRHPLA